MPSTHRMRYTLAQKARAVEELRRSGVTNGEFCRRYGIQNHQLNEWKLAIENGRFVSKNKKSLCKGRRSIYAEYEDAVATYIFQRRSTQSIVTVRSVINKLVELCPSADEKTYKSKQMWAYRFFVRNRFSIRRITRNVTISDDELERRRITFLREIEERYARNLATIFVNMDQVSVVYGDAGHFTVDIQGAKSVQARTGLSQVSRTTVALSVASNGEKLLPFIIYKGTRDGRVACEFARTVNPYPRDLHYAANQTAWMTEEVMLEWIELILVPFALRHGPENICLVLDSFTVHLKDSVKAALYNRSISTIYIPGGLTGELQPLDVGVNAPFRHYIREAIINSSSFEALTASEKRHSIARSVSFAFSSITQDTVINSFNRMLYSTFDNIDDADEIDV